jgi:hypothetical protein
MDIDGGAANGHLLKFAGFPSFRCAPPHGRDSAYPRAASAKGYFFFDLGRDGVALFGDELLGGRSYNKVHWRRLLSFYAPPGGAVNFIVIPPPATVNGFVVGVNLINMVPRPARTIRPVKKSGGE